MNTLIWIFIGILFAPLVVYGMVLTFMIWWAILRYRKFPLVNVEISNDCDGPAFQTTITKDE